MTAALAVSTGIAALSVTGVTLYAYGSAPPSIPDRVLPAMLPNPDGWLTEAKDEQQSAGNAGTSFKVATYTLHYLYFHAMAGRGRGVDEMQAAAQAKVELIFDTLRAADSTLGVINIAPSIDGAFNSIVESSTKRVMYGCAINVDVIQFINA